MMVVRRTMMFGVNGLFVRRGRDDRFLGRERLQRVKLVHLPET
jgi:hypothetical protein